MVNVLARGIAVLKATANARKESAVQSVIANVVNKEGGDYSPPSLMCDLEKSPKICYILFVIEILTIWYSNLMIKANQQ